MPVDFFPDKCITKLNDPLFGLCDIPPRKAFVNKVDDGSWIATVLNESMHEVTFVAVDVCLELKKEYLSTEGYDIKYGARPLKGVIRGRLRRPLAKKIVAGDFKEGDSVEVSLADKDLIWRKL
jgi:hypothetical protein